MGDRIILRFISRHRMSLAALLVPVLLLPLPLVSQSKESLTGYLLLMMGIFWCTEIIPLAITALMPVVFLPLFGILTTHETCACYMTEVAMLLVGGIILALAIENVNLHRRIAFKAILLIGFRPKWLILGFMLPAWFLSMWISNTATTAMMMPIVDAVLEQLHKPVEDQAMENLKIDTESQDRDSKNRPKKELMIVSKSKEEQSVQIKSRTTKALILGILYAANVGSTGTLIGGVPNQILQGFTEDLWEANGMRGEAPVTFATWMVFGFPLAVITFFIVWIYLNIYLIGIWEFLGFKKEAVDGQKEKAITKAVKGEYNQLGPISGSEISVICMFGVCALLWFFRRPVFMPGWGDLFNEGYTADAIPAILMATVLFIVPKIPNQTHINKGENNHGMLMDWNTVQYKFSWTIILLVGGGIALADGVVESGLAQMLGDMLDVFSDLPGPVTVTLVCFFTAVLTQFMTSAASSTLLLPIVSVMALNMGKNPLYLMLPTAASTSYGFMLPVSGGSNTVVYGTGKVSVFDMIKIGIIPNILVLPVLTLAIETWGYAFFNLGVVPWDSNVDNSTTELPMMSLQI